MRYKLIFYGIALLSGFGWYAVLLSLSTLAREWILGIEKECHFPIHLILFPIISLVMSHILYRWIAGANKFWGHLLRAVCLPYIGCLILIIIYIVIGVIAKGINNDFHDYFTLFYWGPLVTTLNLHVVIPYALAIQFTLNYFAKKSCQTPNRIA